LTLQQEEVYKTNELNKKGQAGLTTNTRKGITELKWFSAFK